MAAPKGRFVEDGAQKVGEWTGTAYRMTGQSCQNWGRFVVKRGPGLEAFDRVMRSSLLYGAQERRPPPCELQAIDLIGAGVLLWIDFPETRIEKLEIRKIDPDRFRLPSQVLSRSALFEILESGRPGKAAPSPTHGSGAPGSIDIQDRGRLTIRSPVLTGEEEPDTEWLEVRVYNADSARPSPPKPSAWAPPLP
jgi:hypothetical protein